MDLTDKIRTLRKKNGWSQNEFANIIGVSRQTVSKWELGEVTPGNESLKKLSEIFQIPLESLVEDNGDLSFINDINNKIVKSKNTNSPTSAIVCILIGFTILCSIFVLSNYIPSYRKTVMEVNRTDVVVLKGENDFEESENVISYFETYDFISFINTYHLYWIIIITFILIGFGTIKLLKFKRKEKI